MVVAPPEDDEDGIWIKVVTTPALDDGTTWVFMPALEVDAGTTTTFVALALEAPEAVTALLGPATLATV